MKYKTQKKGEKKKRMLTVKFKCCIIVNLNAFVLNQSRNKIMMILKLSD